MLELEIIGIPKTRRVAIGIVDDPQGVRDHCVDNDRTETKGHRQR